MRRTLLLLSPRWKRFRNRMKAPGKDRLRIPFIVGLTAALWAVIYVVFVKALQYFTAEEMFGTIAAIKLLSMILITFTFVVIISSIITAFSTFFLSEDLELIMASPAEAPALYASRFIETMIDSTWMVLVFGLPVFLAYGRVFSASWSFYALSSAAFLCLLIMTTSASILVAQVLVKTFPVRKLRDLFILVGLLVFVGVYLIFRMVRPEEFLNPEGFASVMDYLSVMSEPSSPFLPTTWILELVRPYITGYGWGDIPFYCALLVTAAAGAYRLVGHYHQVSHFPGFSKATEGRGARLSRSRLVDLFDRVLELLVDAQTRRLILKELLLMARDWGRISQLLLLSALIVVYLYNFSVLPNLDDPAATRFLKNTVAFINIGLAGFVLASLGVRFLFPTMCAEGRAFWILKGAPVSLKKVLWVKFFFYLVPMTALGLFLAIVTNRILGLGPFMFVVCTATVAALTVGITALSIGMGVLHADLKLTDPNRAFTGFGAMLTMIYAGLAVAAVILLEVYPVYRVVTAGYFTGKIRTPDYFVVGLCFAAAFGIVAYMVVKPLKAGLRRISELEI
ncbi:MAG: hypothetical protein FJ118_18955 [Deltaproteobacteria bacterium]|nr:hypothetical protein [Deltaproteobacteria bacterium]